ncbi:2-dehydro-3-deoxygalactonokinase [Stappia sp. BW2]|uniref:2-dehydro-3-deoxygalactonokinase n=1 Tax=Stappia sp. BW2 TaxID=2592622 RepID=UPI0011DE94EB|nr:2-dehydro-3-deoxygalactonokinase [Stappia sp. BW2]TYC75726.1 2-dehydro-3-deoxygalactonokinase [Stappia sp. BW2]
MTTPPKAAWIAADWGTTNLRIWALDETGGILAHRSSDKGMGRLEKQDYEPALIELVADLLKEDVATPVIVCGMAGSRQGWAEAPYMATPCAPPSIRNATRVEAADPRLDVRILPGIKQLTPPDVMRGEETQIAGFLADNPGYTGTLCLPGTHTKWVALKDGRIERFRTFMTGETFALLFSHSVLRHGLSSDDLDNAAFAAAAEHSFHAPEMLTADLFGVRAAGLVADLAPAQASGRLSGLLIGVELAAVSRDFDLGNTALLGSDKIVGAYRAALTQVGYASRQLDAQTITLKGLTLAYSSYEPEHS